MNSDQEENTRLVEPESGQEEGTLPGASEKERAQSGEHLPHAAERPAPNPGDQRVRQDELGSAERNTDEPAASTGINLDEATTPSPADVKGPTAEQTPSHHAPGDSERRAPETEGAKGEGNRPMESACILDGSKLILRIASPGKPFQVDHGLKIIMADGPLKRIERSLLHNTYVTEASETTVVVDAGGAGLRFVPLIPSLLDGVVYTRDGCTHVVLSGTGAIQRSRVSAPNLPTRVVNKFVSQQHFKFEGRPPMESPQPEVLFPWSTLGHESGQGGVIFVRCDESIYSHRLKPRKVDLSDGRIVAWSSGVTFQNNNGWFCFKRLSSAAGQGSIWIDNGKPVNNPNVVLT